MTRPEAREFLKTLGIAEPTEENITAYLNQLGAENKKHTDRLEQYKTEADKAKDLQKQLDEINNANLSEIERANKATEEANNKVLELEKQMKAMQLKADLATNGIVGESAEKLMKSISDGNFDANVLGEIIAEKTKNAVAEFEKQKLDDTPNPNGGSGDGEESKPADVANAEGLFFGNPSATAEEKDYYVIK